MQTYWHPDIHATVRSIREAIDRATSSIPPGWLFGRGGPSEINVAPLRPSILPKNYLVEFVAGTFGPASSGRGLTDHLESEQRLRRVVTRTNLGVMAAQDLEANSKRKLEEIQMTRAIKFKHAIELLVDHLEKSVRRDQDRPHVIREIFSLDDSPVAEQIAAAMSKTRFLERLASASKKIPEGRRSRRRQASTARFFVSLEGRFRTEFASFIPEMEMDHEGVPRPITDDKALKIINRIFDTFAPRMILIGHSQGGLVALRAMQLGMRQVRVKDKRRFLYSPRSGRVHRYSPVAFAVGLGAPFDGIDQSPSGLDDGKEEALHEEGLPSWVRRTMPGVSQMLHGSNFLKTLRGAFIPFDCSAISIANPRDGVVPLEGTLLPVGDFKNMHNLEVASSRRFDVADIGPRLFRPALAFWPATRFRKMMNEDPRFEGMRQHCSFLIDLDENWDVDKGEIVKQIFGGKGGKGLFDEMLFEVNFDGFREQLMANLLYRLRASNPEERQQLAWMAPRLRHMIRAEELPFRNSLDKRAALALPFIEPQ